MVYTWFDQQGPAQRTGLGGTLILTDTLGHVVGCLVDSGHPSGTWFTHGLFSRVPHRERVLVVL